MILSSWLDSYCSIAAHPDNIIKIPHEGIKAGVSTELTYEKEKSSYKEIYLTLHFEVSAKNLPEGYPDTETYLQQLRLLCLMHPEKEYLRPYIKIKWPALEHILSDWRKNNEKEPVFMIFPSAFKSQENPDSINVELKFTLLG